MPMRWGGRSGSWPRSPMPATYACGGTVPPHCAGVHVVTTTLLDTQAGNPAGIHIASTSNHDTCCFSAACMSVHFTLIVRAHVAVPVGEESAVTEHMPEGARPYCVAV